MQAAPAWALCASCNTAVAACTLLLLLLLLPPSRWPCGGRPPASSASSMSSLASDCCRCNCSTELARLESSEEARSSAPDPSPPPPSSAPAGPSELDLQLALLLPGRERAAWPPVYTQKAPHQNASLSFVWLASSCRTLAAAALIVQGHQQSAYLSVPCKHPALPAMLAAGAPPPPDLTAVAAAELPLPAAGGRRNMAVHPSCEQRQ